MADYVLIDRYLAALRMELRGMASVDDVVDEVCDHLLESFDRYLKLGMGATDAEQHALAEFGDARLVGTTFTKSQKAGAAVPTTATRSAGVAAHAAAALWVIGGILMGALLVFENADENWQYLFPLGSVTTVLAGILTLVTMAGLRRRHGGLNLAATIGLVVFGLGVAVSVLTWAIAAWMPLEGLGALLVASAMFKIKIAPRFLTRLFGVAFLLGGLAYMAVIWAQLGDTDSYGDYVLAGPVGLAVGIPLMAAALGGLGTWLRDEIPTDRETPLAVS